MYPAGISTQKQPVCITVVRDPAGITGVFSRSLYDSVADGVGQFTDGSLITGRSKLRIVQADVVDIVALVVLIVIDQRRSYHIIYILIQNIGRWFIQQGNQIFPDRLTGDDRICHGFDIGKLGGDFLGTGTQRACQSLIEQIITGVHEDKTTDQGSHACQKNGKSGNECYFYF